MLILSRRRQEAIVITTPAGEQLRIEVHRLNSFSVRLGITAPQEFLILREELDERPGSRSEANSPSPLRKIA